MFLRYRSLAAGTMHMLDAQFLISHQITKSHRKQMTSSRFMAEIAVAVNRPLVLHPLC